MDGIGESRTTLALLTVRFYALSQRTNLARSKGVNTGYTYDNLSRLLSVLHQLGGITKDGATYTYDNVGNRTSKTFVQQADPDPISVVASYSYDNIYQLTQTLLDGGLSESFSYDEVGNRTASLGVSPYLYNNSNELTSTPLAGFSYDENGNMTSKTDAGGTTNYTWDYENRLVSASVPGTGTVNFAYDPFGRRILKSSATATTIFAYDGDNVVEELDGSGSIVARYSQGLGIDEPLAMYRGGTASYYHADGLGSITTLTDGTGTLAASYVYDSFGSLSSSTGSLTNSFRYTGREFDSETGLYYYRARSYDPYIARFVSEDRRVWTDDSESVVNAYVYVRNNPADSTDPFGQYSVKSRVPYPDPILDTFLYCTEGCYQGFLTVTSTSEEIPQHPTGTPHRNGQATDIRYPDNPAKLLCCASYCGFGYALDERLHPSAKSTGAHVHLQMPSGRNGGRGDLPSRTRTCNCDDL